MKLKYHLTNKLFSSVLSNIVPGYIRKKLLKNNSYKELGKKAKDYVTKFEWNNIVNEYLKIL